MVAYGIAKARAMANRTDWNERTEITKAVIIWFDADYEYELEIENEDRMDNEEFTAWVEENAESLAKADAEENGTTFEEIDGIDFTEKEIDDDALFDEEYENAQRWVKKYIKQGKEYYNDTETRHSDEQYKNDWEISLKMALIFKDLLHGNAKLVEKGFREESFGRNAIVGGFQGQRQWTDYKPNADFAESILNSSFDWNGKRAPIPFATENDTLNGLSMMLQTLLTNQASVFADVRTYWSPEAVKSVTGGICGGVTVSVFDSMRYGVSRGCFSNEAGMGSGAITAAAADSEDYVLQGYINMTAVFWDTIVLCTITGLMIVCSGVYESSCLTNDGTGQVISGVGLAILAYEKVFGKAGGLFVGISIILFAFTTIIGWEYQGEMALGYIIRNKNGIFLYRNAFVICVFIGAVMTVNAVWRFSDIANGLMIIPNLISIIVLKDVVAEAVKEKQD